MPLKKAVLLESFSEMNIDKLDFMIEDSKIYHDADKETILRKLSELFAEFKRDGDTALIPYAGKCMSDDCTNKGCKGFSFSGNETKKHVDFIIEEIGEDLEDFCRCSRFKTDDEVEKGENIFFDVYEDERADFKPSFQYLQNVQVCEKATSEILKEEVNYLTKEDYSYWLTKYAEHYSKIGLPFTFYGKYKLFNKLYSRLKDIIQYSEHEKECEKAVRDYHLFASENEEMLIKWLLTYTALEEKLGLMLIHYFVDDNEVKTGFVKLMRTHNLHIAVDDYKHALAFKTIFDEHYWPLMKKYSTITDEESCKLDTDSEDYKGYTSLEYHLKKRGMI